MHSPIRQQRQNLLNRHAVRVGFVAAAVLQNHLRGLLHRGEGAANQVVSVNDNVHAVRREFILRRQIIGCGNDDKRRFGSSLRKASQKANTSSGVFALE